jgi:hypothetical protein
MSDKRIDRRSISLVWFVKEALDLAGISHEQWFDLPRDKQICLIRTWEQKIGAKQDFVRLANFLPIPTKNPEQTHDVKPQNCQACGKTYVAIVGHSCGDTPAVQAVRELWARDKYGSNQR